MQAVILAAGRGTRLGSLTRDRSKAMLPILGQPIVARVIESLDHPSIEDIIILTSPADQELHNFFNHNRTFNGRIRLVEQANPSGTGDALRCAAPYINTDFLLTACDNLLPQSHIKSMLTLWDEQPDLEALLTLLQVSDEQVSSTGIVSLEGDWVTDIVEKPSLAEAPTNIGSPPLYIFSPKVLRYLPYIPRSKRGEYELQDAIRLLIKESGRVRGLMAEKRFTLTNSDDLLAINRHFLSLLDGSHLPKVVEVGKDTEFIAPVWIEAGSQIGRDCRIGPCVYLETGCKIGDGADIRNAVILRGSQIPSGAQVDDRVLDSTSIG